MILDRPLLASLRGPAHSPLLNKWWGCGLLFHEKIDHVSTTYGDHDEIVVDTQYILNLDEILFSCRRFTGTLPGAFSPCGHDPVVDPHFAIATFGVTPQSFALMRLAASKCECQGLGFELFDKSREILIPRVVAL